MDPSIYWNEYMNAVETNSRAHQAMLLPAVSFRDEHLYTSRQAVHARAVVYSRFLDTFFKPIPSSDSS